MTASPFHEGEREVQARLGVRDQLEARGRKVVRDHLPEQHRRFYAELPFVVVAARDAASRPWATLLTGAPGFIQSPDPETLRIRARVGADDALSGALTENREIGLLGIDLARRRRNRVNGRLREDAGSEIVLGVEQSFGNCPRFIHVRDWEPAALPEQPRTPVRTPGLSDTQRADLGRAETFFLATGYRDRGAGDAAHFGMDASHRGGPPGFVQVENANQLVFPDYAGNDHFNTFGNLVRDPRIGLVFVDFERGDLLQLTGQATIDWRAPDTARFPGALRLVRVRIDEVVERKDALPLRWSRREAA